MAINKMALQQQNRILRFLMVLAAVLLMIFIYASYYSNTVMTLPARLHPSVGSPVLFEPLRGNGIDDNNDMNNDINDNDADRMIFLDKQNSVKVLHKLKQLSGNDGSDLELNSSLNIQTFIDNNSLISSSADGASLAITNGAQNSNSSSSNSSRTIGAPVINANAKTNSSLITPIVPIAPAAASVFGISSSLKPLNTTSPAIARVPVSSVKPKNGAAAASSSSSISNIDTLKGVRTCDIYESGHRDFNPQLCPDEGEAIRLLILITSAPKNQEARLAIRQTWGHYGSRRDVSIGFVIGRSTLQQIEDSLSAENYLYGDLIRGHFIDSYNNLTLKTISILEWIDHSCPRAAFALKTDDDMFINVAKLLNFIEAHRHDKRTIYGRLAKKWRPIRNQKSKYYVSPGQFQSAVFPQFTTGPAYLLTADTIHDLYVKSLEQTYLKLEDVYTTGIVAQLLNIKRIHVNEFLNRRIAFNPCHIRKAISVHMIKSNEQFDLWKKLLDTSAKCK